MSSNAGKFHASGRRGRATAALTAVVTVVAAAAVLVPASGARARSTRHDAPSTPKVGYVDVSVATVWTDPSKPRPVDAPALTNPVHIQQWLDDMSTAQRLALTDNNATQTQALYGNRVDIIGSQPGWYEVAVPGQPTPKNPLGYPGWVPADQVSFDGGHDRFGALQAHHPFALVDTSAMTTLYRDPDLSHGLMQISYDTRLPVVGHRGQAIEVATPGGGAAWLPARAVSVYTSQSAIPTPTSAQLVSDAKMFLGRPYLWAGTSGYAFDCSGLTHTLYHANGITIGRDADAQADFTGHGTAVARNDLKPGDIIFYASDLSNPSTIYHDAMYVGDGNMIEAYGAGIPIRIVPVRFNGDYWGAERYLPAPPAGRVDHRRG